MRYRRLSTSVLYRALFVLLLSPAGLNAQVTKIGPEKVVEVDQIFARWDSAETPGCVVGVSEGNDVVLSRAYGMADLELGVPNSVETVFEAGSVSKQFTAAAILLLAERGALSLDDDVRRYLPEVPDYGTPITIRHLIHHTSGLRDWGTVATIGGWPRTRRAHTNAHALDIISRQRSLNYEPGAAYSYTNSGYNMMAIIVERVSGKSLADFSKEEIFGPLGMTKTEWRDDFTRIVRDRAKAYRTGRDGFTILMPNEDVYGNGGLLTTVGDLLIWNENLESGRVGGPALVEAIHRRGKLNDGTTITYAGGLRYDEYLGYEEINHSGSTAGYQAFLTRYPEAELSVAVLCNATGTNPTSLARHTAAVFLTPREQPAVSSRARAAREEGPDPFEPSPTELEAYPAKYWSGEAEVEYEVTLSDRGLALQRRPGVTIMLRPVSPDTFRASNGWEIRFRRDDSGAVDALSIGASRVFDLLFERRASGLE